MVAKINNRTIVTLILLVFISLLFDYKISFANGKNLKATERSLTKNKEKQDLKLKIVEFAKTKYKKALDEFEKQTKYCWAKESKNTLKRSIFKNINLTERQLEIAIYSYYKKAFGKCENDRFGLYLIQRGMYSELLKHYKMEMDDENPKYYDDFFIFGTQYTSLELELKFLNLPKKERDKLDKIPELKALFRLHFIEEDKPK